MFLQYVKCLRYGTLHYVTWGWKTCISLARSTR